MSTDTLRTDVRDVPRRDAIVEALASGRRPRQPGPLASSLVFGWRALLKIKHVPEQLTDVTMFPIVTTLLFTLMFGGALAGSVASYVQYLMPGIITQSVLLITMYTGTTLRTDVDRGVFDRFRSLPVWRPAALVGMLLGDAARFSMASLVMIAVGVALGWRPGGGPAGVALGVAALLVFAFALGWVWTYVSLVVRTANALMGISMMVLFPLTFASNIFVDPRTLPAALEAFVGVNPISHVVNAVRALMDGTSPGSSLLIAAAWAVGLVAVFGPLAMRRYRDPR